MRLELIDVENSASFLQAARSGINIFAGAGWSLMAQSELGPLPVGDMLTRELRTEFGIDPNGSLDLPQLSTVIAARNSQGLEAYLRKRFTVATFDPKYRVLEQIAIRSIFTTNIDDLFEAVLGESNEHFLNDVYTRGAASSPAAIDIVKLHGSVRDSNRPFVFGPLDLAAAATSDPDRWMLLRQRLRDSPTLFTGYSLRDAGTLQVLRSGHSSQELPGSAWIQIRPGSDDPALIEYFRAIGFQIIVAETEEILDYLDDNLGPTSEAPAADSNLGNVPYPTQVPPRPLEDFFLGAAPSWSDIYSPQVVRCSHFATVLNNIAAGANTLLSGIPGSGKTTLLMQVAAQAPFDGPRILLDSPSAPEAELLIRQVGEAQALILVDNVAGDIEALVQLTRLPHAVVVAADRDYNLSSVSHRIAKARIGARLATSALTPEDLQRVWHSIPVRIRRRQMERPKTSYSIMPTVNEMVRANLSEKSLDERLIEYVGSIYRSEPEDALMLILACYMHYSRVPLSMDVAVAFFRDYLDDYRTLYAMLESVGDLLSEYQGFGDKDDQDYFAARSMQVAENVLNGVPGSALRRMLQRFQANVTPLRVPSYDIFRRRGYDYRLFARAFSSWVDGADEYEKIKAKLEIQHVGQQYYVEQQKALFLAEHRQFDEAFREIDKARGARKRVNWTIENTYNRILFRANLIKAGTISEAQSLCFRALDGLENAYDSDQRKGLHALVYADCSLRLSRAIDPELVRGHLERAEQMLKTVLSGDESWLERPKYVIREVERRLRDLS
ncbi:SIR2 family protein [Citricoccus nitrophenolicus]